MRFARRIRCSTVKSVFSVSNSDEPVSASVPDSSSERSTNTVDTIGRPKNVGEVRYARVPRDPTV